MPSTLFLLNDDLGANIVQAQKISEIYTNLQNLNNKKSCKLNGFKIAKDVIYYFNWLWVPNKEFKKKVLLLYHNFVIAGYTSYRAAVGLDIFKMFLLDSSNVRSLESFIN